jgi:hypothetical protein
MSGRVWIGTGGGIHWNTQAGNIKRQKPLVTVVGDLSFPCT